MNTTGYYGKMPQRGDFVSGRLTTTFTTVWDDWSQQLVSACSDTEKEDSNTTEQLWFQLPVYRFLVSADIAGDQSYIGLMLPSKDSVGRLYPLCLARSITLQESPATVIYNHQNFFIELEKLAADLFSGELPFDDLTGALKALDEEHPSPELSNNNNFVTHRQSGTDKIAIRLNAGLDPAAPHTWQLATESLLSIACAGYSIWTTSPLSKSSSETILCEGLPGRAASMALFTGDFDTDSWSSVTLAQSGAEHRESGFSEAIAEMNNGDENSAETNPPNEKPNTQKSIKRDTDILTLDELGVLDDLESNTAPWDD